jgi:long-chain acyl-CoA synthetase
MHAVAAVAGVDESAISSASRLREDFGFDSLMYVELASALEGVGQGRPDADSLSRVESVADIVALVGAPPVEPRTPKDPTENTPYYVPSAISEAAKEGMRIVQAQFNGPGLGTKVYGRANIPQNRQTIVVSNHTSHLDMGLVKYALGDYGNRVTALAAKDYFFEGNRAKITWFTHFTNVEPLDRKTGFRASMREARAVIDEGRVVLLFPEGTRQTDGTLGEFKPLVGKLSLDTGVDILPLYIDGAHKAMPKGRMLPTRSAHSGRSSPRWRRSAAASTACASRWPMAISRGRWLTRRVPRYRRWPRRSAQACVSTFPRPRAAVPQPS